MGSKKVKKVKDKRSKKELVAALAASGRNLQLAAEWTTSLTTKVDKQAALLIPFRAVSDKLAVACPPGVKCNQLVNVIAYPCGAPSVVVETSLSAWRALEEK